jgi:hypothetical protein
MKMKIGFLVCLCVLTFSFANAQKQAQYIRAIVGKAKLGISQIELEDGKLINGNVTQVEFLYYTQMSSRFGLEFGFGFSQFNGNDVYQAEYVSFKNNNLRFPVNLLYSHDLTRDVSLVVGLGAYGMYYARTSMPGYYEGSRVGLNVGVNSILGANFNVSEKLAFRMMAEVQRDLTKIEKPNQVSFRERMNALMSLGFVFKL